MQTIFRRTGTPALCRSGGPNGIRWPVMIGLVFPDRSFSQTIAHAAEA
ncbi:hypothetical protein [Methylobacterium sp. WCS2018Hpa-22]|nr:hypothetical protein [Methylobacterium sp. WCS2018Hpa-22]